MTKINISIHDRLLYRGAECSFDHRHENKSYWINDLTRERFTFTDDDLARELAGQSLEGEESCPWVGDNLVPPTKLIRCRPAGLSDTTALVPVSFVPPEARSDRDIAEGDYRLKYVLGLRERNSHLKCVIPDLHRAINAIAAEIGDFSPPEAMTAWRWIQRGGEHPTALKLSTNRIGKGRRGCRFPRDVTDAMDAAIQHYHLRAERPSIASTKVQIDRVIAAMNERILELNLELPKEQQLPAFKCPSWKAVKHRIESWDAFEVTAAREGIEKAREAFEPVRRQRNIWKPLEFVEIDYTTLDLIVVDEINGMPLGRPTIAMAIDRATRVIWGVFVSFEPPSIHTFGQLLLNGLLPKTYLENKKARGEWDVVATWPVFGRPGTVVLDREMAHLGESASRMCQELGFNAMVLPRKTPRLKGAIERAFGVLNVQTAHLGRGTTFSNAVERGDYDSVKEAVVAFDELLEELHRWIVDVNNMHVHSTLRDMPLRRWNTMTEIHPVNPVEDLEKVEPLLGWVKTAKLTREGVRFLYLQYITDELVAELRTDGFRKACPNGKVTFRFLSGDLRQVWVYMPHLQKYLRVPVNHQWRDYAEGLSLWQHVQILKFERKELAAAFDPVALNEAKGKIADKFMKDVARRGKLRTARKLARFLGKGRHALAGDRETISPTPMTAVPKPPKVPKVSKASKMPEASKAAKPGPADDPKDWLPPDLLVRFGLEDGAPGGSD